MKKRNCHKTLIFALFCAMFSLAACQKGDNEPATNDSLSQKIDNQGRTEQQNKNLLELKGTAFGELPAVGTEDPVYCNLPENTINPLSFLPVCYDPLYDILYYVDYNGDSLIHAVRDEKSEIAVPFTGKRLFCRKGKLYFLLDANTDFAVNGAKNGNILSYDPVTGEIAVIMDEVFEIITVYQDCIFCGRLNPVNSQVDTFFYFFDTGELITLEKYFPSMYLTYSARYGDYFFASTDGAHAWMLCRLDGSETIPLDGFPDINNYFYLKGDDVIWFEADSIHLWNIPSKEEKVIEISRRMEGTSSFFYNNYFYEGGGNYIDAENGITKKCRLMSSDGYGSDISEFCTDGKRVYGFAFTYIEETDDTVHRLCCIEWRSLEDAFALVAEDETALERLNYAQKEAIEEEGAPLEGILLLTPIDQLFQ